MEKKAMFNRHVIRGLLAGVALVAASASIQAGSSCCGATGTGPIAPQPAGAPAANAGGAAPAAKPATRTITCYEQVPEYYETTRTCYKTEWAEEKYTAYKHECVPETRTRTKC